MDIFSPARLHGNKGLKTKDQAPVPSFSHFPFPAPLLELVHLVWSYQWTEIYTISSLASPVLETELNDIIGFPWSLPCRWRVLEYLTLSRDVCRFLIINLCLYIHIQKCICCFYSLNKHWLLHVCYRELYTGRKHVADVFMGNVFGLLSFHLISLNLGNWFSWREA